MSTIIESIRNISEIILVLIVIPFESFFCYLFFNFIKKSKVKTIKFFSFTSIAILCINFLIICTNFFTNQKNYTFKLFVIISFICIIMLLILNKKVNNIETEFNKLDKEEISELIKSLRSKGDISNTSN